MINLREWALPIYTILMQLAIGSLLVLWLLRAFVISRIGGKAMDQILRRPLIIMFFTIVVAVIGSHFHLSNPLLSFLAVLNIQHSWLSREIFFTILTLLFCSALIDQFRKPPGEKQWTKTLLGWIVVALGYTGLYCMASIYRLPTQSPWNHWSTILQFISTSLILGSAAVTALLVMDAIFSEAYEPELVSIRLDVIKQFLSKSTGLAVCAFILIIALNFSQIVESWHGEKLAQTSLALLLGLYRPLLIVRFLILTTGVLILMLVTYQLIKRGKDPSRLVLPVYLACFLSLVAEILGRFLFYATHVRLGL